MTNAIAQWASVVLAGLMVAAIIALARTLGGKASKSDIDKDLVNLRDEAKAHTDATEKKFEALQAEGLRQYRELRTLIEVIQKELTLLDKHSLTSNDLLEMKADIKELVKGTAEAVKLIDGMPDRLSSLEATRNKQSAGE